MQIIEPQVKYSQVCHEQKNSCSIETMAYCYQAQYDSLSKMNTPFIKIIRIKEKGKLIQLQVAAASIKC